MVDVMASVLDRAPFTLQKSGTDVVIMVDTVDPNHVCILQTRLLCSGHVCGDDPVSFCLGTCILSSCLKNVSSTSVVRMEKDVDCADVFLHVIDSMTDNISMRFKLNTFDQEPERLPLDDIVFDITTEVSIPEMKKVLKLSQELKVNDIEFTIMESDKDSDGTSVVMMRGAGDAEFERRLPSTSHADSDRFVSRENESNKNSSRVSYSATFVIAYLLKFVRPMEQHALVMKFGNNAPMLMEYPLGVEKSFARIVLAPKIGNDDE